MRGEAILFSEMTPGANFASEFHDWYDHEHIPIRMNAPGFSSAQRYRADAGGGFLAVYELSSPEALQTPAYQEIKGKPSERTRWMLDNVTGFTRYTCRSIAVAENADGPTAALGAPVLYAVAFTVPEQDAAEFDAWNEQDHVPLLMQCPDWLQVRRFEVLNGEPEGFTRLTLHYLRDKSALQSKEREAARATEWRKRLAERPWFRGDYKVYHSFRPRQTGCDPKL